VNGKKTPSLAETLAADTLADAPSAEHPVAVRVRAASTFDGETRFFQERLSLLGMVATLLSSIAFVLLSIISLVLHGALGGPVALVAAGAASGGVAWIVGRGRPRSARLLAGVDAFTVVAMSLCFTLMATLLPAWDRPELVASFIVLMITATRAILLPSSPRRTLVLSVCVWLPVFLVPYAVYGAGWEVPSESGSLGTFLLVAQIETLIWAITSVKLVTVASRVIYGLRKEVRDAQKLGQYTLLEKLGEGGMGQVFRAQHAMLRRPTAVKLLHPDRAFGPEDLARFEREVQLTAQLSHPNVVTVFDYGRTPDGVFYYAMELLDGHDLEDIVERSGPLPAARVVHILLQVASALAEAHAVGLIHRDIKPANIILCARGRTCDVAKVVDFGLVKQLGPAAEEPSGGDGDDEDRAARTSGPAVSRAGSIVGTPMYLAPEAFADPGSLDGRADLYALGAVAYFLLTGTVVFGGRTVMEACRHHVVTVPEPPSKRLRAHSPDATIPDDLEQIVLRCLRKGPADRPQSAKEVLDALTSCAVAGEWTDADARAAWTSFRERPAPSATAVTGDGDGDVQKTAVSVTAKTIAIDLTTRAEP
jgi:serine/threonine protein kinase